MLKSKYKTINRSAAWLLAFLLTLEGILQNPVAVRAETSTGSGTAQTSIEVTQSAGYEEGAYAEWKPVAGADGYLVYVSRKGGQEQTSHDGKGEEAKETNETNETADPDPLQTQWTLLDDELIRSYGDYIRADALGLTAGEWQMKIVAATFNSAREQTGTVAEITQSVTVTAHDRSGYAWVDGTASGAYNEDGSLKENARVIYITQETKNTVQLEVEGASSNPCVGLQAIFNGYKNARESRPLAVRVIGNITDPASLSKGDLSIETSTTNRPGVTIEGVGEDAVINGWGISIANSSNLEIRNLAFMNCDSVEGDNVSLTSGNDHIWVHNCDMFYGEAGSDDDQKKGDGALDCKLSDYVTFSYNHFWDSGKCNLLGLEEGNSREYHITYHHNWYDHSDSRHPRVRFYTAHVYNNYYDGNSKYGIGGAQGGGSIFAENNYFRNCKYPMLISMQGTDVWTGSGNNYGSGTLSKEDGSLIKAFGNYMEGQSRFIAYRAQDDPATAWDETVDFDAYVAERRDERVPDSVKTVAASETVVLKEGCTGGNTYNNFDTAEGFYEYTPDAAADVPAIVKAHAGRLGGGDFKWQFDNATADASSAVDEALKKALSAYATKLQSVGGIMGASEKIYCTVTFDPGNGDAVSTVRVEVNQPVAQPENPTKVPEGKVSFNGWFNGDVKWDFSNKVTGDMTLVGKWYAEGEEPGEIFHGGTPIGTEEVLHDITKEGLSSKYFAIDGELYTKTGTSGQYGEYNGGNSYRGKGLILNSTTKITFSTTTQTAKLVLLTHNGSTKRLTVDGVTYQPASKPTGVVEVDDLAAGEHVITGRDSDYLFVIIVIPGGEVVTPAKPSDAYTVTLDPANGTAQTVLSVKKGAAITESALPTPVKEGYQFTGWADRGGNPIVLPYAPTGDITLTATWLAVAADGEATHTVQFHAMGGLSVEAQTVTLGETCKTPTATARSGYDFTGWYKDYACTEKYDLTAPVNTNLMLFAGWQPCENAGAYLELDMKELPVRTYTEEFAWNGFTLYANSSKAMSVEANSVSVPDTSAASGTATYSRRLRLGGAGSVSQRSISFSVSGNALLTVVAASGTGGTKRALKVDGGSAGSHLISDIDAAAKYTQELTAGTWSVYSTDSNVNIYYISVTGEGVVQPEAAVDSYVVRIDTANGSADGSAVRTIVLKAGDKLTADDLPTLTKEGDTFLGWVDEEGKTIELPYEPTRNMTISAKWKGSGGTTNPGGGDDDDPLDPNEVGLHVRLKNAGETYTYTGSAIKPAITVTNNGKRLVEGRDYTVKYSNNTKACEWGAEGDAVQTAPKNAPKITVTGKGNFSGSTFTNFRIARKDIGENDDADDTQPVEAGAVTVAKGSKATPVLVYNGVKLGAKDYTYDTTEDKNRKWGSASVTEAEEFQMKLLGAGNYKGERTITIKAVAKSDLKGFTVTVGKVNLTYNGTPQTPDTLPEGTITVKDKKSKEVLTNDANNTYYQIVCSGDATNAGTVKFSVVGVGEYTGTVTKSYKINPEKDSDKIFVDKTGLDESYPYDAQGVTIGDDLKVYYGSDATGTLLEEGTDYKLTYSKNKKPGEAGYTVTMQGNFKGAKKTGTFQIAPASLKDSDAKVESADKVFKKQGIYKSAPIVTIGGVALKTSDYKVEYYIVKADNSEILMGGKNKVTEAGTTIKVKVSGKGSYKAGDDDCVYGYYQVCGLGTKADLSKAKITFYEANADGTKGKKTTKVEYTGKEVKPAIVEVTLKVGKETKTLKEGDDYTLTYVNNKNKGKATVIVTAAENSTEYAGSKTAKFTIAAKNLKTMPDLLKELFKGTTLQEWFRR
ncbi:MAG: InlB B-repeat-containing protein [Muribaculum sp.]|nr:InlB B-repeat-containing protein [Muribaculum sp.]